MGTVYCDSNIILLRVGATTFIAIQKKENSLTVYCKLRIDELYIKHLLPKGM
jgi:hypothetical protein